MSAHGRLYLGPVRHQEELFIVGVSELQKQSALLMLLLLELKKKLNSTDVLSARVHITAKSMWTATSAHQLQTKYINIQSRRKFSDVNTDGLIGC